MFEADEMAETDSDEAQTFPTSLAFPFLPCLKVQYRPKTLTRA